MNTTLTIDKAGRVVLPKLVRDQLQLLAGDLLVLDSAEDRIVLRPVRGMAGMREKGGIWVFRTGQPVSIASVNETLQRLRDEREQSALSAGKAKPEKQRKTR